jgi:tetratricopeptide (TPR) repeat protein
MGFFARLFRSRRKSSFELLDEGKTYCQEGDCVRALAAFTEAIQLEPRNAKAYYLRGSVFFIMTGEVSKAIMDFSQAIRCDATQVEFYRARAEACIHAGEYDQAITDYSEVIRLAADAAAFSDRSLAHIAKREFEKAIADATEAIRRDAGFAKAYFNRGSALGEEGRYDLAIADFQKAIELDPNDPHSHMRRNHYLQLSQAGHLKDEREGAKAIVEGLAEWMFGEAWLSREVLPQSSEKGTEEEK